MAPEDPMNCTTPLVELITSAASSQRLATLARRVANSDCTVLIVGESGTGKEVLARYIHHHSTHAAGPFIAVNCAAIPESMLEAVLFGYERGAFTGALNSHVGKFEQAQGGTLLLDEISEMPLGLQAKLLRVLQEREIERLGSRQTVALDARILATTNRRLREEVAAGRFREDLYYRLNVFRLTLLPLRERREDILPLTMQLMNKRCMTRRQIPALSAAAAHLLLTYSWPGNVRELDNLIQRALILVSGPMIEPEHVLFELPAETAMAAAPEKQSEMKLADSLDQVEQQCILEAIASSQGNRRETADKLGISPRTLRQKLARLRQAGIDI